MGRITVERFSENEAWLQNSTIDGAQKFCDEFKAELESRFRASDEESARNDAQTSTGVDSNPSEVVRLNEEIQATSRKIQELQASVPALFTELNSNLHVRHPVHNKEEEEKSEGNVEETDLGVNFNVAGNGPMLNINVNVDEAVSNMLNSQTGTSPEVYVQPLEVLNQIVKSKLNEDLTTTTTFLAKPQTPNTAVLKKILSKFPGDSSEDDMELD